jgi:hypothetical protein
MLFMVRGQYPRSRDFARKFGLLVEIMPIIEEHDEDAVDDNNSHAEIPAKSSVVLPKTPLRYKHRNKSQKLDTGMSNP